jgi:PAS domain S-box-containing protein
MAIIRKELLEEAEKLRKKNRSLQRQLREARQSMDAIKAGNTDAMVVATAKDLKIYTEKTADITYRILVEKMNEGAVTVMKDGTILYCNSCFAGMVKLSLKKIIGSKFKRFMDPASAGFVEALFKRRGEIAVKEEIYIHTMDGETIPMLMSVNTLLQDASVGFSIILTDLTIQTKNNEELKRRAWQVEEKNRELEQAHKDLTSFTYVSSHDLQEPLRKIQSFITCILLEEEKKLSESGKGYFRRMQQAAKRMQALIEDLLAYLRISNSGQEVEKTNMKVVVGEVKTHFERVLKEKKATIEVNNLGKVDMIHRQFHLVMHNLISNSLKFSNPARALRIVIKSEIVPGRELKHEALAPEIDYCHIAYADNGIGFDPRYGERIFEVFQRLHGQEEYKGTGMGLAICKKIIENHHGIIQASGKVNAGARFDIYIPVLPDRS